MSDEPLDHVAREPLPWRDREEGLTECGRPLKSCQSLTLEQMREKVKAQGERRASLSSCMTCWETSRRYEYQREWRKNVHPIFQAVQREIERVKIEHSVRLGREFHALALLAEAHREEFDAILRDMNDAIDIRSAKKKTAPPQFGGLKL